MSMGPTTTETPQGKPFEDENKIEAPAVSVNPQHYMMFVMLLEAAMRHREAYWRESIADYRAELEYNNEVWKENYKKTRDPKKQKPMDRGWERRTEAKVDSMVEEFTRKIETFNKSVYAIIDKLKDTYSEEGKKTFDEHATCFSVLCGEMNIATLTKDPAELLVLTKMYNAGQMDSVFKEYRALNPDKQKADPETPKPDPIEIETKLGDVKLSVVKDDNPEGNPDAQTDPLIQKIHPFPHK